MTTSNAVSRPTMESFPVADLLLDEFTPVDRGVQNDLDVVAVQDHVVDLVKRLTLAAELSAPGTGGRLVWAAVTNPSPGTDLLATLDAVLEFGRAPAELTQAELDKAARAEIRQEILHFDRIMDLESLTEGRSALKARRDVVHDSGLLGAVERLLVLVHERLTLRGDRPARWQDLSAPPQGLVQVAGRGSTLTRSRYPLAAAAVRGSSREAEADLLRRFERCLIRHPLPVALGVVDYEVFLGEETATEIASAVLHREDDGELRAELLALGTVSWVVLRRDGFRQQVVDHGVLTGKPAGAAWSQVASAEVAVPEGSWLLLAVDGGRLGTSARLEVDLNVSGRSGRVDLARNLSSLVDGQPYVLLKAQNVTRLPEPALVDAESTLAAVADEFLAGAGELTVSLECGHVHADREVSAAQLRGLDMGVRFDQVLREAANGVPVTLETTPMVDDDHVLNRFSFVGYRKLFADRGLPVDDLILESSPLPRAVAHDVLRRAMQRAGNGYELRRIGDNLYLEAPELRLELVEDLDGEMRNGCVLFEVGLVMYRAARTALTDVFTQVTGSPGHDLHGPMADAYDSAPDPVARTRVRTEFEQLYRDPWSRVTRTVDHTPFLDRYLEVLGERAGTGHRTIVFNVLEDYYRPQQEKVARLGVLLDIPLPLHALFFSPHGRGLASYRAGETPCR